DVVVDDRGGLEVVHGDVEEALDLGGVQVQGDDAVGAGAGDEVGDELGGDGHAADVLAVLAGVAVVGQHGRDAGGAGALEAVDHDQQLHEVLVDRRGGRLDEKDVAAAHVLVDADEVLAVGEVLQVDAAEGVAEAVGDALGQGRVGPAAEDLQLVVVVGHEVQPSSSRA